MQLALTRTCVYARTRTRTHILSHTHIHTHTPHTFAWFVLCLFLWFLEAFLSREHGLEFTDCFICVVAVVIESAFARVLFVFGPRFVVSVVAAAYPSPLCRSFAYVRIAAVSLANERMISRSFSFLFSGGGEGRLCLISCPLTTLSTHAFIFDGLVLFFVYLRCQRWKPESVAFIHHDTHTVCLRFLV